MKVMEYELKKMRYNELKNEIKLCGEIYKDNDWVNLNEWNELRKMFSNGPRGPKKRIENIFVKVRAGRENASKIFS